MDQDDRLSGSPQLVLELQTVYRRPLHLFLAANSSIATVVN